MEYVLWQLCKWCLIIIYGWPYFLLMILTLTIVFTLFAFITLIVVHTILNIWEKIYEFMGNSRRT